MTKKSWAMLMVFSSTIPAITMATQVLANEPPLIVEEPFQVFPEIRQTEPALPSVRTDSDSMMTDEPAQVINDVQIQGGTVFDLETIAQWLQPIIGRPAEQERMIEVVNKITTAYAEAGYPLSYAAIPPGQDLTSGRITIVLVEGYLARTEIEVDKPHIKKRIERYVAHLMDEKPLTRATFERYTGLIEATPGYTFRINVPRPQTLSGATTIRVEQVNEERFKTGLAFDNTENDPNRFLGSLTVNSLTSYADQLTIAGLIPNENIDRFYSLNYAQDLNSQGLKLELLASHFKTANDDRFFVADIPVDFLETKTRDQFSVGLKYPLQLQRRYSWWIGSKVHHLDEQALFQLNAAGNDAEITKDIRYSALEAFTTLQFNTGRSVSLFQLGIKQGVDLGANKNQLQEAGITVRGAENLHFNYFTSDVFWRYRLSNKWQFRSRLNGQWSDDVLPSAEQARYGGNRFARGYPEGQAQGDRGYAGEIEIKYLQQVATRYIQQIAPYFLVDGAQTELRSGGPRSSLSSATIGLEVTDNNYYGISLEYSLPTGDMPVDSNRRSAVYNLRLRWQF